MRCLDGATSGISFLGGASNDILQIVSLFWMPSF